MIYPILGTGIKSLSAIEVRLWGQQVGALAPIRSKPGVYEFQYAASFVESGLELSPFMMPLNKKKRYSFPALSRETYHGLPGLLSDALPDYFGNTLIHEYLIRNGIGADEITPLHKLLYMGHRAIGALEFEPALTDSKNFNILPPHPILMAHLVEDARKTLRGKFDSVTQDIIDIGSSAGGARAKAVVGWNKETQELVSGQFNLPSGFEHWLLKFDGVGDDRQLGSTHGFGRIEYAHYLMALDAGIEMNPCQLMEENGRAHFMTKRFDRVGNQKIHLHSLCGIQHLDFNMPYTHSYEQYFRTILKLKLGAKAINQAWIRCAFNIIISNCDDHTKNYSFLMQPTGEWTLAPAYDVCFAYNPNPTRWTHQHQLLVNGKAKDIELIDLYVLADTFGVHDPKTKYERLQAALARWPEFAGVAGVSLNEAQRIQQYHHPFKCKR